MTSSAGSVKYVKLFSKWQLTAVTAFVILFTIFCSVHTPLAVIITKECIRLFNNNKLVSSAADYDSEIKKIKSDNCKLDSMLSVYRKKDENRKITIVEALYTYADNAGIKASKVEIGEVAKVENHTEIPVAVRGIGTYGAIGMFTASIENADQAARIRSINISSEKDELLNVSLDFVISE